MRAKARPDTGWSRRWRFIALGLACLLSVFWLGALGNFRVVATTLTPLPAVTATPDRFAPPVVPENPTQADAGAYVYYLYCMACHGDRGQGLTEDFRAAWGHEESNCWQSKCHASNYPPGGFELPAYVPALIGEGTLGSHTTVQALQDYIRERMPYHRPGVLADEEYWAVTAFLAQQHGVELGETVLTTERAADLPLHPAMLAGPTQPAPSFRLPLYVWGTLGALLLLGGGALVTWLRLRATDV